MLCVSTVEASLPSRVASDGMRCPATPRAPGCADPVVAAAASARPASQAKPAVYAASKPPGMPISGKTKLGFMSPKKLIGRMFVIVAGNALLAPRRLRRPTPPSEAALRTLAATPAAAAAAAIALAPAPNIAFDTCTAVAPRRVPLLLPLGRRVAFLARET
eukprot:365744-Chlamydomonas_euryale.AAC.18